LTSENATAASPQSTAALSQPSSAQTIKYAQLQCTLTTLHQHHPQLRLTNVATGQRIRRKLLQPSTFKGLTAGGSAGSCCSAEQPEMIKRKKNLKASRQLRRQLQQGSAASATQVVQASRQATWQLLQGAAATAA
jgi:hypothetical protein